MLVLGESGTGKELVARAIHDFSARRDAPFIAVNMAAIPRELIESELFGHERGAFTGAQARTAGRFEQAQRGTLFLDEIGDMPMEAQTPPAARAPVGRILAGRRLARAIRADVRIIAATHQDLPRLIGEGQFREDLYYRLNVVPVRLPPLRERGSDIGEPRASFPRSRRCRRPAAQASRRRRPRPGFERHGWPGNVRELENLMPPHRRAHPATRSSPRR